MTRETIKGNESASEEAYKIQSEQGIVRLYIE